MKNTPHEILSLEPNQIFVFGSNTNGVHGKGAALTAKNLFGAKRGVGAGPTGKCYAIPTRVMVKTFGKYPKFETLSLDQIAKHVYQFLSYAAFHTELEFLVTPIGCGYAGYKPEQIAPMFRNVPTNVILPVEFH